MLLNITLGSIMLRQRVFHLNFLKYNINVIILDTTVIFLIVIYIQKFSCIIIADDPEIFAVCYS